MRLDENRLLLGGAMSAHDLSEMAACIHEMIQHTEGGICLSYNGTEDADLMHDHYDGDPSEEDVRQYLMACMALGVPADICCSSHVWEDGGWQTDVITFQADKIGLSGVFCVGVATDESGNTHLPWRFVFGPAAPACAKRVGAYMVGEGGYPSIELGPRFVLRDLPALHQDLRTLHEWMPPALTPIGVLAEEVERKRAALLRDLETRRAERAAEAEKRKAQHELWEAQRRVRELEKSLGKAA